MLRISGRNFLSKEFRGAVRLYGNKSKAASPASGHSQINGNVPGLSEKCVSVPNNPVGPGAAKDKEYKNPEYYCYHVDSFAEAEIEMAKFRLPAPSNKRKFVPQ